MKSFIGPTFWASELSSSNIITVLWMVTKHLNVNVSLVHSIHLAPVTPVMISALSTSFISLKAFWELYISSNLVLESSGITPGDLSGSK